jgi:DNA polymerase III, delta subunit
MYTGIHHALVIDGHRTTALAHVRTYVTEVLTLTIEANPDVSITEYDRFGVDDARALKTRSSQTPLGPRQVFVIATNQLTREAQNGLLKLLEEPPADTHFILVVPTIAALLPTVRSRVLYAGTAHETVSALTSAEQFYHATIGERLALVSKLGTDKDRQGARAFVSALEQYLHARGVTQETANLAEVAFVSRYLGDTSSSIKMLLEHLAVSLVCVAL